MHALDNLLVGLVLLAAVIYATYSLGPKALRRRGLASAASLLKRLPQGLGLRAVGTRLAQAAAKPKSGCGGCETCGSDQPASATTEVSIPLSKVGKRG